MIPQHSLSSAFYGLPHISDDDELYESLKKQAIADNRHIVVDAVLLNDLGQILIQKRSDAAAQFPGHWEVPGGHLEQGESILQCLKREVREETQLEVLAVVKFLQQFDWEWKGKLYRNFHFFVLASGSASSELLNVSRQQWINETDAVQLFESEQQSSSIHLEACKRAWQLLKSVQILNVPARPGEISDAMARESKFQ